MKRHILTVAAAWGLAAPAPAQPTIHPAQPFTWAANPGWLNLRPTATLGLRLEETAASGLIWSANVGWINLGTSPANGHTYSNTGAADWGVNVQPDGRLRGFAWAANLGWTHFESHGDPRVDLTTGTLLGHAWSANAGWLALGAAPTPPATTELALSDTDDDGLSDAWERQTAGNLTTLGTTDGPQPDHDGDGSPDLQEYLAATDPINPASRPGITGLTPNPGPDGGLQITFPSVPSRLYRIETTTTPDISPWPDSGLPPVPGSPTGTTTVSLPASLSPTRLYRVVITRPLAPPP